MRIARPRLFHRIHLLLSVVGIVLGILFLEMFLRVFGLIYGDRWHRSISRSDADKALYRIVALGESTTARLDGPAWPEFLEEELNRRVGTRKFRVYNLGVSGSNSSAIVQRLYEEAMQLHPDMVITMMGINDIKYLALPTADHTVLDELQAWIKRLRVYKFFAVLDRMIMSKKDRTLVEKAMNCTQDEGIGDYDWIYQYLPRYRSIVDPAYPPRYSGQFLDTPTDKRAEAVILEFLDRYPFSYQAYETLVDHYATRSKWDKVVYWSGKARDAEPFIRLCIQMNQTIEEQTKDVMLRHVSDIEILMESVYTIAQKIMNQPTGSDKAFYEQIRWALEAEHQNGNINTSRSYETIAEYLKKHNIAHIAMQYPLLPVEELRDMLKDVPGVTFVSNEQNFQEVLRSHPYSFLFKDNFAGVFGHTTLLGSQLIASAAADAVLQIVPIE